MTVPNPMNRVSRSISAMVLIFLGASALANEESELETYGSYTALTRDGEIVQDVKNAENGRIYLVLNPDHKEKEIILKNSNFFKTGYRNWFNGKQELVSPDNQGKAPNEYTDWVETTGNYVEYYMGGRLILHLAKTEVHNTSR